MARKRWQWTFAVFLSGLLIRGTFAAEPASLPSQSMTSNASTTQPAPPALRAEGMALLEDIERTRMLLGAAMWRVHDLRNLALSGAGDVAALEALDRRHLELYETIKPIDYAACSLLAALDVGDDMTAAAGDVRFLRAELAAIAPQVLEDYQKISAEHDRIKAQLVQQHTSTGLVVKTIAGQPWDDATRERQRQIGVQIGWRTNLEPPDDFRETYWNRMQSLDIRYQLAKAKMLGVDHIVPKDPLLRWDLCEPTDGQFDFAALDRAMALAGGYDLRVKLYLPTLGGCVPQWWANQRPQGVLPTLTDDKGNPKSSIDVNVFSHNFMGPEGGVTPTDIWYQQRAVNLDDVPTRERFAAFVKALNDHIKSAGYGDRILMLSAEHFFTGHHWPTPGKFALGSHYADPDQRAFVLRHYGFVMDILRKNLPGVLFDLEVSDGEAHGLDNDFTAHEWRSLGLSKLADISGVSSETPYYEDLLRGVSLQASADRAGGKEPQAGPFFYQNCEYGFGTMVSINFFTAMLRDGLWNDGWFGAEGILRWGYFPPILTWNDRQLQWSGITNGYLAYRQAHALSPTLANTRVTPADVLLLLPSSSMDLELSTAHRELVGWGWVLTALKIPYDVITEESLAKGVPSRARLLILPQAIHLDEPQVKSIREFVSGGGLLFSSLVPAIQGHKGGSLLDEVIGCEAMRKSGAPVELTETGIKGTWWQTTVLRGLHSGKYQQIRQPDQGYPRKIAGRDPGRGQPYHSLVAREGAKVVGEFLGGEPALVVNTFGKGKTLTSGYPIGNEIFFADWTSIAFGKIYNGWARDEQMLGMIRELKKQLEETLGYHALASVPEGWKHRLQGFEAAVSSLAYPKGPPAEAGKEYFTTYTYLDARPDHQIKQDHDELDYAAELTWRDRPGVETRYLCVANRESAYAGERGGFQFWMMPHLFKIRIDNPRIQHVFDVAGGVPVKIERDDRGVSFTTSMPPAEGRIYAISMNETIELFESAPPRGMNFDALAKAVSAIPKADAPPATAILSAEQIRPWIESKKAEKLTICYGTEDYRPAAERLAKWITETFNVETTISADDGKFEITGNENFQITYVPSQAQILIGNAWSNNAVAQLDCTWPYNNPQAPALTSGRLTATYAWPGRERGVVVLTRARELRKPDHTTWGMNWNVTLGYLPIEVDTAPSANQRRKLLLLASTPEGAAKAVDALAASVSK